MKIGITWRGEGEAYRAEVLRRVLSRDSNRWPGDPTIWIIDEKTPWPGRKLRLSAVFAIGEKRKGARLADIVADHVHTKLTGKRPLRKWEKMREDLKSAYADIGRALEAIRIDNEDGAIRWVESAFATLDFLLQEHSRNDDDDDDDDDDEEEEDRS